MSEELTKILVVDDDDSFLNMAVMALQRNGYQVESAPNGATALEILKSKGPFAVMLTDRMMPGINGLELLEQARQFDENLEVIMVTAVGTLPTAIKALRDGGAYDYLTKPLESVKQIPVVVERALAHRQLRMEREALSARVATEAQWLQSLIANTGDAILAANANDELIIVNPAAERLLGKEELLGSVAQSSLPVPLATALDDWQASGEQGSVSLEISWEDPVVQMLSLTPVVAEDGQKQGWVMALRDITHLKQIDKLKTQMLTAAANNIRIPLAQGVTALADLSILVTNNSRAKDTVYRLHNLRSRIQKWGDKLLTMAQIDSDMDLRFTEVDLKQVLTELPKDRLDHLITEQKLKLSTEVDSQLPCVYADYGLVQRLLEELIIRAAVRSRPGGEIRVHLKRHEDQVWIEVGDDGPAVRNEDFSQDIERPAANLGQAASTGLELSLAKTIVDRMGGQVWVGTQAPQGSVIMVSMPIASEEKSS